MRKAHHRRGHENPAAAPLPVAPHICEEIWQNQQYGGFIHQQAWPFDEKYLVDDQVEIAVQINGKVRAKLMVPSILQRKPGKRNCPGRLRCRP